MSDKEEQLWINKKSVKWTITAIMIMGLIVISYDLFLSPTTPEERQTATKEMWEQLDEEGTWNPTKEIDTKRIGEELATNLLPVIIQENMKDDPEIKYDNTFKRAEGEQVPTEKTLVLDIPQTVFDMILFIKDNPDFTDEEVDLLLSYAVGKERDLVDEEVDSKVQEIMVEYLEQN